MWNANRGKLAQLKSQHEKFRRSTWNLQPPCYTFVRWMWDARSCILHCHGKGKRGVGTTCLKNNMKSHHGEITHALKQIFHKHPKPALKQIFHKHLWKNGVFLWVEAQVNRWHKDRNIMTTFLREDSIFSPMAVERNIQLNHKFLNHMWKTQCETL